MQILFSQELLPILMKQLAVLRDNTVDINSNKPEGKGSGDVYEELKLIDSNVDILKNSIIQLIDATISCFENYSEQMVSADEGAAKEY